MSFFLFPQLITSTLEAAINKLAELDDTFIQRCQPMLGKRLIVDIQEIKNPLLFVTCEQRISVMSAKREDSADCTIRTSLSALKELKDPNQITRLIKEGQLELIGDIQLAQQVSEVVSNTHINWEEHLSYYIGDGLAHKVATRFRHFGAILAQKNKDFTQMISELVQDELEVSPHKAQVDQFSQKVSETRSKVDKLAAKIDSMSTKFAGKKSPGDRS